MSNEKNASFAGASIEKGTVTLELKVEIPEHYYNFLVYLEECGLFNMERLARSAADGIKMDVKSIHEAMDTMRHAIAEAEVDIEPVLVASGREFKAITTEQA